MSCYSLATALDPGGSGTINAEPAPNCGADQYRDGTVVHLTANASAMGEVIAGSLRSGSAAGNIAEIRGRGLMLGVQLTRDCSELTQRALDAGLLINMTAPNTIRLLPPLIITESEARALADSLGQLIREAA